MSIITFTLVLIIAYVTLFIAIIVLTRSNKDKSNKIEELEKEIKTKNLKIEILSKHLYQVMEITEDEKEISEKIRKAENDEDVTAVIRDIININNNKLLDNKGETGEETPAATKTAKKRTTRTKDSK